MKESFFHKLTGLSIVLVEALALMGLLGWTYDTMLLASFHAKYIPIAPSTAMMFILLSGLLWFYPKLRRSGRGTALWFLVSITGFLFAWQVLLAFVANDPFNIESFLISQPQLFQNVLTGRMSATTAGNFMILTLAMVLMMFNNARSRNTAGALALLGNFVGLVMVVGYIYDTPLLYGGSVIPMALPTALAFFFLSFGILAAIGPKYFPFRFLVGESARARLLRAFLPVTMLAILSHGALYNLLPVNFKINYALFSAGSALFFQVVVAMVIIHTARVIGNNMDNAEAQNREAEEELRESEQRFRLLVEHIPGAVYRCRCDTNWEMEFISRWIERISGYPASDFIHSRIRSYSSVIHPEDRDKVEREVFTAVAQHQPYTLEYRLLHANGSVRWVYEQGGEAIKDKYGNVLWLDGVILDVTEQKLAREALLTNQQKLKMMLTDLAKKNEELQEARSQLIHSEKMAAVGQLSAGVAHEIKNPLAIILLSTEEIESRFGALIKDEGHSYLQMIKNASSRANRVITDLLNFSRYSQVNPATLHLYELIDQSIALVKNSAKLKQIDIHKEYQSQDVKIEVDKLLFEQVMINLITNAIDAIDNQGTVLVRTFLKENTEDHGLKHFVCIEVIDNGSGIPPEVIPRIFEPFFTTKEQGKGTGLGLSIVYMILERHGGKIEVQSKLGKGTKFLITLPVKTGIPESGIVL